MFWHSIWVAEDWHPAVVESILDDGRLKLIFIEYGKPQEAGPDEVRAMEDVADEGEEGEGECEMCERDLKLTFHHLIPKDGFLASQYNTLQKLLAHPVIQRWLEFAKKRRASSGKSK
eukprot:g18475.t1